MKKQLAKWMTAAVLLLVMANVFNGCKKDEDDPPTCVDGIKNGTETGIDCGGSCTPCPVEVTMENSLFAPVNVTVPVGTTVTWVNDENMLHTVTASDSSFYSPDMAQNATFSHTFTTAGSYSYYCIYHFGMTGGIIVQ